MNCHEFEPELGDYVDGTLPPEQVEAVSAHVDGCVRCRAIVADFKAIRSVAQTLEPQMPATHVWTRIAAALEQDQRQGAGAEQIRPAPWWRLASGAMAWKPVIAAAAMLVLLVAGTWLAWRDASGAPATGMVASGSRVPADETSIDPEVQLAEQHYSAAIGDLEKVTQTESGSLDPQTAQVVHANLEVIDQAIGQSREALKSEPTNPMAQESLFDALRSKVQLLQDTVALINEMRKGNQDGAARIISGMNP